jgi:DNA modification methylase
MTTPVIIGDATLYLGDCREILPTLGKVDAVVTDPPYGIGFKYSSYDDVGGSQYMQMISVLKGYPLALLQYPEEMMRYIVPILGAPDDCFIWCYNSMNERQSRIWGFWGIVPDWYQVYQEPKNPFDKRIVKNPRHYDWCADLQQVKNVSEDKTSHPCQLPTELVKRIIKFTKAEIVLDPFMGSGTTGVACAKLGRKFIGIEIDPGYFAIACKRIEQAYSQPDFFIAPPAETPKQEFML